MATMRSRPKQAAILILATAILPLSSLAQTGSPRKLDPAKMTKTATVDPRYLSYNIEMVEVTGGRFWAPYKTGTEAAPKPPDPNRPAGIDPTLFQYRKPIDLSNARLRKLASALEPAYMRVSGTWANSTYFQDSDAPAPAQPPDGFRGVLTRAQWKGVIDFSKAADAEIVTSVAISSGVRNSEGVWTSEQAKALFDYTRRAGGTIAASEFMNEPTIPGPGNAPKGYDAAAFARDAKLFGAFLRKESPETVYLGPGGVGEGAAGLISPAFRMNLIKSEDILKDTGPIFDAFSYHFYGSVSKRCGGKVTVETALTPEWLDSTNTAQQYYAQLRDTYMPGKPMWLNETAEAACGGDLLAAQFVDTFRFLNQLGTLAQKGVKVVMHNTLAASDYGLLDETNFEPRPDFWAAVLWKRTMGSTVLNPEAPADPALRVYAQCMKNVPGGVTLLALNTDQNQKHALALSTPAERYTLASDSLTSQTVSLNGKVLKANPDGSLPAMNSVHIQGGTIQLDPLSVTFLTIPSAGNKECTQLNVR